MERKTQAYLSQEMEEQDVWLLILRFSLGLLSEEELLKRCIDRPGLYFVAS